MTIGPDAKTLLSKETGAVVSALQDASQAAQELLASLNVMDTCVKEINSDDPKCTTLRALKGNVQTARDLVVLVIRLTAQITDGVERL